VVQFLNTNQSKGEVESILTSAKSRVVFISPYVKFSDEIIPRLEHAGKRNIRITMVCREGDLREKVRDQIEKIPNLILRFNEDLHAKCFYNESTMVITSANLYESSRGDNREMGVLLDISVPEDIKAFDKAVGEASLIIDESVPAKSNSVVYKQSPPAPKNKAEEQSTNYIAKAIDKIGCELSNALGISEGHCIRCGKDIPLNLEKPLCLDCYNVWVKIKNSEYGEKFCHECGKKTKTSMKHPVCSACYQRAR